MSLLINPYSHGFAVDAADFDGTNDYMLRGAELTGMADGKQGIVSAWVRLDGGNADDMYVLANSTTETPNGFGVSRQSDNKFTIWGVNAAGTKILHFSATTTHTSGATWRHVLASWDLAVDVSWHFYIDDVSEQSSVLTFTNDTLDYTKGNFACGSKLTGATRMNGALAEVYFAPGQHLDFSVTANRRKFISASGKPVNLGTDGSAPTGVAPIVYFHLDNGEAVANFATNRGSGGNFAITGTLDTASTSPSD